MFTHLQMDAEANSSDSARGQRGFRTTHWSIVLSAGGDSKESQEALDKLCRTYWYPLYGYIRSWGRDTHTAQDLTQEFFARLLARDFLRNVDPTKGRFRSFLLVSLKRFLSDEREREGAQKRGGHCQIVSLEELQAAEDRFTREPADNRTPEQRYDRFWADTVIENATARLRTKYEGERALLFERLKGSLTGDRLEKTHAAIAEELGLTENVVRIAAHKMRTHFGQLVRSEVAQSLEDSSMVDEELQALRKALETPPEV